MFCDRLRYGVALPALPSRPQAVPQAVPAAGGAWLSPEYLPWQREAGSPSSSASVPELLSPSGCPELGCHTTASMGRAEGVQNPTSSVGSCKKPIYSGINVSAVIFLPGSGR